MASFQFWKKVAMRGCSSSGKREVNSSLYFTIRSTWEFIIFKFLGFPLSLYFIWNSEGVNGVPNILLRKNSNGEMKEVKTRKFNDWLCQKNSSNSQTSPCRSLCCKPEGVYFVVRSIIFFKKRFDKKIKGELFFHSRLKRSSRFDFRHGGHTNRCCTSTHPPWHYLQAWFILFCFWISFQEKLGSPESMNLSTNRVFGEGVFGQ